MLRIVLHIVVVGAMLVSSIGAAAARGSNPAVDRIVICGGHGTQILYLDASGDPTRAPHLCPDCILHFAAAPTDRAQLIVEAVFTSVDILEVSAPQVVATTLIFISARGPPHVI